MCFSFIDNKTYPAFPKPTKRVKVRKPLRQIGKKGRVWVNTRAELKKIFAGWGITTCEIRIPHQCTRDNFLGFAHAKKRKKLGPGEIWDVILACNNGHDIIEKWPAIQMETYVYSVIIARAARLRSKGVAV
jgi:hypothetical protein